MISLPVRAVPLYLQNPDRAKLAKRILEHVQKLGFLPRVDIKIHNNQTDVVWLVSKE